MGPQPAEGAVSSAPPFAPLFARQDQDLVLACAACGREASLRLPFVVDWRDRTPLESLLAQYPTTTCPYCGAELEVPAPVLVLRPGDPVPVVFCFPRSAPNARDQLPSFETALAMFAANDNGVIQGPIAEISPQLLPVVAAEYSGFAVTGVPCPGQEWADTARDWISAVRAAHDWPGMPDSVNRFVTADTENTAFDIFTASPPLQDPAWEPVIRRLGVLLVQRQEDSDAAALVRQRMRMLAGYRMTGAKFDASAPESRRATELLGELVELQSRPNRTRDDVTRAIAVGRTLIEYAKDRFGASHPLVATATNDTAALLLDDAVDPEGSALAARALLQSLREGGRGTTAPLSHGLLTLGQLADATTNLALSLLPRTKIVDSDTAETVLELLRDAVHLHHLHSPDDPAGAISALANLASLTRSRLVGDPETNVTAAIALFDAAVNIANGVGAHRRLSIPDRIMLGSNRTSALADLARLRPGPDNDRAVWAAIIEVEAQLAELDAEHPVRAVSLANFGAIGLELINRDSPVLPDDAHQLIIRWLSGARDATRNLAADDSARLVATMNLAAALFRTGDREDTDAAKQLLDEATTAVDAASSIDTEQTRLQTFAELHLARGDLEGTRETLVGAVARGSSTRLDHTLFQNLAQMHFAQGDMEAGRNALIIACVHADRVIDAAKTTATRLAQVAGAGDLFQRLAFAHAHLKDARSAIHAVERSRARWRHADRYDEHAVDRAVAAWLRHGESLLYLGTCGLGSWAVLLIAGGGTAAWVTQLRSADLAPVLRSLQAAANTADVSIALAEAARLLSPLLTTVSKIAAASSIERLAVIAGGPLAGLPLGALPCDVDGNSATAGAANSLDSIIAIRYLTAALTDTGTGGTAGTEDLKDYAQAEVSPDRGVTLAVVNPTGDLTFAASELDAVRRFDPQVQTPGAGVGVRGWLLDMLPTAARLHVACHARYDPADPLASRFVLGERLSLTIADLADLDLHGLELVVASCCQSGVVDLRAADELVGLAYALIAAGAGSVIAALWDIDDARTSLLVAKLYEQLASGKRPGDALLDAQRAMRTITMRALAPLTRDDADSWVPHTLRAELRALALHPALRDPESRPFEDPAHWSALVYIQG